MFPPSRKMFVDNEWVAASNGATYAVPNPATEEAIGTAPEATVEDMRRAIAAARRAFDEGPWPRSSRQERARVITAIADGMERRKEELRQMLIAEAGATYLTHDIQLEQPIRLLRNYAELALTFDFEEPLPVRVTDGPLGTVVSSAIVYRQPAGVCGLIPTWNFPLFVTVQKLGPALAPGCTMVFKPSPYGPLINLLLADIGPEARPRPPRGARSPGAENGRLRARRGEGRRPGRPVDLPWPGDSRGAAAEDRGVHRVGEAGGRGARARGRAPEGPSAWLLPGADDLLRRAEPHPDRAGGDLWPRRPRPPVPGRRRGDSRRQRLDLRAGRHDLQPRHGAGHRAGEAHPHRGGVDQPRHQPDRHDV